MRDFFCAIVCVRLQSPIHRSALHRHQHVSLGFFLSPRAIVRWSYLWLLTVAVNDYFVRYSPYTLRLMVYVTESVSYMLSFFFFPKIEKCARHFASSFCPSVLHRFITSTSSSNTYGFVDVKIERRLCEKRCYLLSALFLKGEYKRSHFFCTVVALMSVTLICNHEVKATKLCRALPPFFFSFATWFLLQEDCLITLTHTEKRVSLLLWCNKNKSSFAVSSFIFFLIYLFPVFGRSFAVT